MIDYNYASIIKRLLNCIIDVIIVYIAWLFAFVVSIKWIISPEMIAFLKEEQPTWMGLTILPVFFIYYLIFESIFHTTIGKLITRTKLVMFNGDKLKFKNVLIRSICRLIPLEELTYLKKKPVGWHDKFSNTRVINK